LAEQVPDPVQGPFAVQDLQGRCFLIIATDRFEESELFGPKQLLEDRGAKVLLASIDRTPIQATIHDDPGKTIRPDMTLDEVDVDAFDALILPGGVGNPDRLRMEKKAIEIIRAFDSAGKPIAAICHGPWLLVEADIVRGKRVTSWPSIRTDLRNAGAEVADEVVVVDGHIITSRKPDDVPKFAEAVAKLVRDRESLPA
jgi:protease I